MPPAFPGQLYRDINNPNFHRGEIAVTGVKDVDLGIGHNNFTVIGLMVKTSLAADANIASVVTWTYHPTLKGVIRISTWKATAAGTTTLIAATAAVTVAFAAIAGASVVGG